MNPSRYLTREEANLIQAAAEAWLRLRDIEFNAGECAAALLANAVLRDTGCERRDVASLGRGLLLEVPGEPDAVPIRLVRPQDENLGQGDVSILSDLGLAFVGRLIGSEVRIPHGMARLIGFAETTVLAPAGVAGAAS